MIPVSSILDARAWAEREFGAADLADSRRTPRLVAMATQVMRHPDASLPEQLKAPKAIKAAYRLLAEEDVTHAAVITPHWERTRRLAGHEPVVLMVQDTTTVDFSHHPTKQGLGPIGNGEGQGFLLHNVLAVVPQPRQVLGIAHDEPFLRQPAPKDESCAKRRERARESDVWLRAVEAVGAPPVGSRWIHVGDRGSDLFGLFETCRRLGCDFLVRAAQNRYAETEEGVPTYLITWARTLPAQDERVLSLPARHGQPAREARVCISFGAGTVRAPKDWPRAGTIPVWVVRVWEPDPPPGVKKPLEWILIMSVPTLTLADAWERVEWYTCRWLVEEYHQCLKTGCLLEQRRLGDGPRVQRLLGVLAPTAVRLLQLREIARLTPLRLARAALPPDLVNLVAHLAEVPAETLTMEGFWRAVAQQGGYRGRRRDGPPGWQTLWKGWLYIQTLLEGVRLAPHLLL
jgi:hypothetical protein